MVTLTKLLTEWGYELIDCQVHNPHLESLGASCISRRQFRDYLDRLCSQKASPRAWQQDNNLTLYCHE
jgi:leucyl/phenylalanyl-tRNA--protein transferase